MSAIRQNGLVPLADPEELAIAYRRVSKEEMADSGKVSLETQDEDIRALVSRRRNARLLAVYTDLESGKKDSRRDYQRMLAHIRSEVAAGRRIIVPVAALARFGRRVAERVRAWDELKALGVTLLSAREGGEVLEVVYNIMAALAQEETRLLSERIKRSNQYYRDHGWLKHGGCRWGYRWRDASELELASGSPSRVVEEDPDTGPYLRELWERAEAGESINALAKWTATLPADARGDGQHDAPRVLSYAGIRQILRAPVYVGRHGTFGDDVLDRPVGKWPALVTDEQWAAVHGMTWRRKTRTAADGRYPLTGLLWCSQCREYRMVGRTIKPRVRRDRPNLTPLRREYACTGHIYGSACQMVVPAEMIERQVIAQLQRIFDRLAHPDAPRRARELALAEAKREERRLGGTRVGALRTELKRNEERLTKAWIDSTEGTLTATAFATIQAGLSTAIDQLKEQIGALERATPPREVRLHTADIEMVLAGAPAYARALQNVAGTDTGRRVIGDAAAVLIDKLWAVRVSRGAYRLEPLYTAGGIQVSKFLAAGGDPVDVASYHTAKALYQAATSGTEAAGAAG